MLHYFLFADEKLGSWPLCYTQNVINCFISLSRV